MSAPLTNPSRIRFILVGLLLLVVTGSCSSPTPAQPHSTATTTAPITPTPPALTAIPMASPTALPQVPVLTIGVLTGNILPAENLALYQAWAAKLSQATGVSLTLRLDLPDEMALLEAMRDGQVALAYLTPWAFVYGRERGWVQPGMMSLTYDGKEGEGITFFARSDSGLQPGELPQVLQQLKGKHPCYLPKSTIPGLPPLEEYILPAGLLALNSVEAGTPVFIESETSSVSVAVYKGECDFGATRAKPTDQFLSLLPAGLAVSIEQWSKEMQVLYTTPLIEPSGLFAFSAALPADQREQLNQAIADIGFPWKSSWKDYEQKMAPFSEAIYAEFERILVASGADPQAYLGEETGAIGTQLTPTATGWTAASAQTLVVDVAVSGNSLFVPFSNWDTPEQRLVMPAIYAELARTNDQGEYFPYLAAQLPTLQNGLARFTGEGADQQFEVEFPLRPGLTWHDGQPLTADDLVFSWKLATDPRWPSQHIGRAGVAAEVYVATVEAPAPDRVIYRFMSQRQAREAAQTGGKLGNPTLYANLTEQVGPVVPLDYLEVGRNVFPKHLLENVSPLEAANGDFARHPIYAGAYRMVEVGGEGEPVILEAFQGFAPGKPKIERVVFGATFTNKNALPAWQPPAVLAEALKAGAIHAQLGFGGVNTRQGEDISGYEAIASQGIGNVAWVSRDMWEVLDFNLDNPHLADLKVRQAIAYALDRQAIINQVLQGHGDLMQSYLPAWHPLYAGDEALPDYAYDPAKARSLLQQAGYDLSQTPARHPTRGPLILQLASMDVTWYPRPPIVALIQQQLAAVGIQVEAKFYPWKDFEGKDCTAIRNGRHFDLGLAGWLGNAERYPISWVQVAATSESIPTQENGCGQNKYNWSGWRNPRADELFAQMQDGRLALEQPHAYRQLWVEHQQMWASELPSLPLFDWQRPVVTGPKLVGVRPSPFAFDGTEDTWNIFEWTLK